MTDPDFEGAPALRNGPDDHPGQWWLDGLLIAGASSEAEARAILDVSAATPADPPVSPAAVKAEAERRILEAVPEWRQRNALAAGQAEAAAAWAPINAVRAASDALEAMDPIPADYAADHHWP